MAVNVLRWLTNFVETYKILELFPLTRLLHSLPEIRFYFSSYFYVLLVDSFQMVLLQK